MRAIGVGDEDLAKGFTADELDDALHASGIQFVEDVVEQQQRFLLARLPVQEAILRQLQGQGKGFVLPLPSRFMGKPSNSISKSSRWVPWSE